MNEACMKRGGNGGRAAKGAGRLETIAGIAAGRRPAARNPQPPSSKLRIFSGS